MSHEKYQSCIDACQACATACEHCATECLGEEDVKMMIDYIRLDRQCALVCSATARLMGMGAEYSTLLCGPCADICEACAEECAKHDEDHCRACAEACRKCAEECRRMAGQHVGA